MGVRVTMLGLLAVLGGCALSHERGDGHAPLRCEVMPTHGTAEELASTPRGEPDLEALAIHLDGTFAAADRTYRRLVTDFEAMRAVAPPELGELRVSPPTTGEAGRWLYLETTPETAARIEAGEYDAWRCLNEHYGATDTGPGDVLFAGTYDLGRVAQDYRRLPGVTRATRHPFLPPGCLGGLYDWGVTDDGEVWRYCASLRGRGCGPTLRFLFETDGEGGAALIGHHDETSGEPAPAWVAEC